MPEDNSRWFQPQLAAWSQVRSEVSSGCSGIWSWKHLGMETAHYGFGGSSVFTCWADTTFDCFPLISSLRGIDNWKHDRYEETGPDFHLLRWRVEWGSWLQVLSLKSYAIATLGPFTSLGHHLERYSFEPVEWLTVVFLFQYYYLSLFSSVQACIVCNALERKLFREWMEITSSNAVISMGKEGCWWMKTGMSHLLLLPRKGCCRSGVARGQAGQGPGPKDGCISP